jgi:hypothetical protein
MSEPPDDPDDRYAVDDRVPRRASPPSPITVVVVVLAGYEVVAMTVNAFLDDDALPSLTTWLRRPWMPTIMRQVATSGRWAVITGAVGTGIAVLAVSQRRTARRVAARAGRKR